MFINTEIRLGIGFDAARDKLAGLARSGLLGRVSGNAYDQWQACLAQAGPQGTMLGMYRIARVRITGMVTYGNSAVWGMRWEVAGRGTLVPALDADIKLIPAGPDATALAVTGVCRPPLVRLADGRDPAVTREVARALIQALTSRVAASVADPAGRPHAGDGTMRPGSAPGAGYRMAC
jgi:hypothetical protein